MIKSSNEMKKMKQNVDSTERHYTQANDEKEVLTKELSVLRNMGSQYNREREKLSEGIDALRQALKYTKDSLQESEKEKQKLKQDVAQYRKILEQYREDRRSFHDDSD